MDIIQIQDNPSPQFHTEPPAEPKIEKPPLDLTNSFLQKKTSFGKKPKASAITKCPSHPEEALQFYCFDNKALLCTECLARGGYSGLEVMNIKRAAEKVKEKLKGGIQTDAVQVEDFYLVEKEMEGHEAQIEKTLFNYRREVKEKMDILRNAIDKKEQEVLEKINRVHEGKLKAVKDVLNSFRVLKGEVESNNDKKEQNLDMLTDIDVCQYYSTKGESINRNSSSEDIAAKIEKAKRLIEVQQSRDKICFTKFDEEFKRVQSYIENFSVDIGIKHSGSISSPTEILRESNSSSSKFNFENRFSTYSILEDRKYRRKEPEDNNSSKTKAPSPRPTSAQKNHSYLTKADSNVETPTPRTPAKQTTPRSTFLGEKPPSGLRRDNSQKSFSSKSTVPFPTNYKDWLNQQVKAKMESATTPKGSAREEVLSPSINSFRSGMTSSKGLVDSFYMSRTAISIKPEIAAKTMLETSIETSSLYRTATDLQTSHREQMSLTNKLLGKNESRGSFEFENPFASKKGQNQVENILASESRLKEKLRKLNSQIFK